MNTPVLSTQIPGIAVRHGKVRDVYDFGDRLLFVATDRISAFDWILPTGIPRKGEVLTRLSRFWFDRLDVEHHFLSDSLSDVPLPESADLNQLRNRSMVVKKTDVVPVECVVRGYLSGSGWKEYRTTGTVCGIRLPDGLQEGSRLEEPVFTPATKAESGHDQNISFTEMASAVGQQTAERLRELSLHVYAEAAVFAAERGIILADTKFEFGRLDGRLILIDEVLTPDSSRFWPESSWKPGSAQPSFDKQFVRDWLEKSGWDKNSPPPELPSDVVQKTSEKYIEAFERLTERRF
ncbi:MAG: phosphoribosylaminoimidazolesuccinocarboxamide synthase [Planctomycetaceae bacterium]